MSERTEGVITLFGGTGQVGRALAATLAQRGRPFRIVGRSAAHFAATFSKYPMAEFRSWDPERSDTALEALAGAGPVIYLVGVPYWEFGRHPKLMAGVLEAARSAGVPSLLLVGTLYSLGMPRTARINEHHPREPHTFKGRMRKAQEDLVLAANDALPTTIVRLPDFYGPEVDRSLPAGMLQAAAAGETATLVAPIDRPHEFVFIPDVTDVILRVLETPSVFGRSWNLGGAGVISQRELAALAYGGPPPLHILEADQIKAIGESDPVMRELYEMLYLLTDPLIVDDSGLQAQIGPIRKTSYADGVAACLAHLRAHH